MFDADSKQCNMIFNRRHQFFVAEVWMSLLMCLGILTAMGEAALYGDVAHMKALFHFLMVALPVMLLVVMRVSLPSYVRGENLVFLKVLRVSLNAFKVEQLFWKNELFLRY